jgi:glycosyltransferase involved in cell wall biosynthesis
MKKISIITINYNNYKGLVETANSVVNQTFNHIEYIIIDGASSDGSKEFINSISDYVDYWVSEPDTGIYNAMNKGIKHANGEYLIFLNSGDYFHSETTLDEVFNKEIESDILYGNMLNLDNNKLLKFSKELTLKNLLKSTLGHQSMLFKKSVFLNKNYNEDYKIISDWILNVELFLEGYKFEYIDITISVFEGGGASSNNSIIKNEGVKYLTSKFPLVGELLMELLENEADFIALQNSRAFKVFAYLKNSVNKLFK